MEILYLITKKKKRNVAPATLRNISITVKVLKKFLNYLKNFKNYFKNLHPKVYRIIARYSINNFVSSISCCKIFFSQNYRLLSPICF